MFISSHCLCLAVFRLQPPVIRHQYNVVDSDNATIGLCKLKLVRYTKCDRLMESHAERKHELVGPLPKSDFYLLLYFKVDRRASCVLTQLLRLVCVT